MAPPATGKRAGIPDDGDAANGDARSSKRTRTSDDATSADTVMSASASETAAPSDSRERITNVDPGCSYPETMPPAVSGKTGEDTVFPLDRRPIRPVPASQRTVGPNLTKEGWQGGQPYPSGFSAWLFDACVKYFTAPINRDLRQELLSRYSARGGLSTNQRLEGASNASIKPALSTYAEFLRPQQAHQNPPFMAGLLGFSSVGALFAFMDLDLARILAPAAEVLFDSNSSMLTSYASVMAALDKIAKTDGKSINTLQSTVGCVMLENSTGIPIIRNDTSLGTRIHKAATLFVALYRIITFFPVRFPDRGKPHPSAIFGFHPNAWSAAYLLVAAFKSRRGKNLGKLNVPTYSRAGVRASEPFRLGPITLQESDGSVQPEEVTPLRVATGRETIPMQNIEVERRLGDAITVDREGEDAMASVEQIQQVLEKADPKFLEQLFKDGALIDKSDRLGRLITDTFESVVAQGYQFKGENIASQRRGNPFMMPDPLTEKETDFLINEMRLYAGIRVNTAVQVPPTIQKLLQEMKGRDEDEISQQLIEERQEELHGTLEDKEAQPEMAAQAILQLTKSLTGGFEPDAQEYAQIIRDMRLGDEKEPRHPAAEKESPPLKPHQAIDAKWIIDKSNEAAHCAIVASDCGLGKTLTVLLALAEAVSRLQADVASGKVKKIDGEPLFKPSVYLCPNNLVHQIQDEWQKFYRGFFNLYTCYGTAGNGSSEKGDTIVSTAAELKTLLERFHAKSDDPSTSCNLILIPYSTARTRLVKGQSDVTLSTDDISMAQDDAADDETDKTKARRQKQFQANAAKKRGTETSCHMPNLPSTDEDMTSGQDDDLNDYLADQDDTVVDAEADSGVRKSRVELVFPDFKAFWVICDEAHFVKNPLSRTHQIVAAIPQDFLLLVTATPLLNSCFGFNVGQEDALEFYEAETWDAIQQNRPPQNGINLVRCTSFPNGAITDLSGYSQTELTRRQEFDTCVRRGDVALFRMHPNLFHAFAEKKGWDIDVSLEAIKPIMQHLSIRRGKLSKLILSDGSVICPGDGIPAMRTKTIELEGSPGTIAIQKRNISTLFKSLFTGGIEGPQKMTKAGTIKKDMTPPFNFGQMRKIAMTSFHADFFGLASATSRNLKLLANPQCARVLGINKLAKDAGVSFNDLAKAGDQDPDHETEEYFGIEATSAEVDVDTIADKLDLDPMKLTAKAKAKSASRGITPGGVKECNLVRANNILGGLRFFFYVFRKSRAHVFPQARIAMAQTFCAHSPKLAYTVMRALELKKEGKRLLIYARYPATCLLVEALLNCIGVRTLAIRSQNTAAERTKYIQKFQNRASNADAMVVGLSLGAAGLNFQSSCHHGLILEEPVNIATKIQVQGRIDRIGQENSAQWEMLYSRHTFDAYLLAKSFDKYVISMAPETHLDPRIKGQLASICLHELARLRFGMAFNAYPLTRVPWHVMDTPAVRAECMFYAALAQAVLGDPSLAAGLTKDDVTAAALRWEAGDAVTQAMLDGSAPLAEKGLVLRSGYSGYSNTESTAIGGDA